MKSLDDVDGSTLYIFITFLLEVEQKKPGRYEFKTLSGNYVVEEKFSSGPASIALL